ncbi:MAG: transcription termination/antitermination NusG family protein [Pseudomonadota bacterium]
MHASINCETITCQWYVVQTKVNQECFARDQLNNQKYRTYLPMIKSIRRRGRRVSHRLEPLFAGYLFINLDLTRQSVSPVRSTRGVRGMVKFGEQIHPVPDHLIEGLAITHNHDENTPIDPVTFYNRGDSIDFVEGPFAGAEGIFYGHSGTERVSVFLSILGQERKIIVPIDQLAPKNIRV